MQNKIKLSEGQLLSIIKEATIRIIEGRGYDVSKLFIKESANASDDFNQFGFMPDLKKIYPDREFDADVNDETGEITVTDLDSGKYYVVKGEIAHDYAPSGFASRQDRDIEGTDIVPHWEFAKALRELLTKIDNDKPDGQDENFIDVDDQTLQDTIGEAVKQVLKGRNFV